MEKDEKESVVKSAAGAPTRISLPVVLDLGKKSKKAIKKLKNGEGKLMYQVEQAIEQARSRLPDDDKNKQIIPVLIIYRKRRKRGCGPFPFSPLSPLNLFR